LAVFVNIFLFCLSACLFYKIGTDIFGEEAGFPAAVIFSLYPSLVPNLTLPQPESLFLFLFLSGIYFFVSFLKNGNLRNLIFATAFVALATLTKEAAIFLPLVMAVLILARFIKNLKQATKPLCFLIIVYLAAVSPWFVRNYYALGRFTLSSKTSGYARFIKKQIVAPTEQNKAPALKQPIDKNRTSNYFSPILDYFKKRKHFFGGTGTLSIMRASGYNVTEIEPAMKNPSPVEFLIALKKAGRRWFVFNALTLIFIGFVYCTSFVALLLLFIRKQYMELFSFISIIVYFLVVYYFHYNSRYFIPIVPFLALLSGYLISNIRGLIRKRG
jgi:4-amino-4-deoxy-L-arabinose transferase-like glycosyltransferase